MLIAGHKSAINFHIFLWGVIIYIPWAYVVNNSDQLTSEGARANVSCRLFSNKLAVNESDLCWVTGAGIS
jgi:hypothetical protein